MISLATNTVDVVARDVMSALCNHQDWMKTLFKVQKFGKIELNPKNKQVSSRSMISAFCVKTVMGKNSLNFFFPCKYSAQKNLHLVCKQLFFSKFYFFEIH